MERAIKELCRLPDSELFEEVATGIGHVVEVVGRLDAAALTLSEANHHHASRILGNLAEEEAAKALLLVDAVRCPRQNNPKAMSRTIGSFYDHLAKGGDGRRFRPCAGLSTGVSCASNSSTILAKSARDRVSRSTL